MKGKKLTIGFAVIGFLVSLVIFTVGYWENHTTVYIDSQTHRLMDHIVLIICPPSIGLIAGDNSTGLINAIGMFLIAIENAVLYGLIGMLIAWIWRRVRAIRAMH